MNSTASEGGTDRATSVDSEQREALELIALHRPLESILLTICDSLRASRPHLRAFVVERLDDDRLHLHGDDSEVQTTHLDAFSEMLRSAFAEMDSGERTQQKLVFPIDGDRSVVCLPFIGLGSRSLGAVCAETSGPLDIAWHQGPFHRAVYSAQVAIEQSNAARNFTVTIDAERERIANQIHDDPIQAMTLVSLKLQRAQRDLPTEAGAVIDELRGEVAGAIDRLRKVVFELHPAVLEDEGLAVALEVYLEEVIEQLGITWTLGDELAEPIDVATASLAFRLCHEALANVARHAEASSVAITLHVEDRQLHVAITDDGRGFDPSTIPQFRPGHLGLANMRYIARRASGRLEVRSAPGAGCTVTVVLPLGDRPVAAN